MTWSAQQYVAFEDERTRPVRDLLAAVPRTPPGPAIDLGCGPGNSTELLAARFPLGAVRGLDSSPDMIAAAHARLPALTLTVDDIERWSYAQSAEHDAGFAVILANAVLQWVPDHERLFPALIAKLMRGGSLAVQMPDNLDQPTHRLMREISAEAPWADRLAPAVAARTALGDARGYVDLVRSTGCMADVWRTTYYHRLSGGAAAIVEWFKGSGLRPFLDLLDAVEQIEFLERYRRAVAQEYPLLADGSVLLPFPRLFIVAVRP